MIEQGPLTRLVAVGFPLVLVIAAWAGARVLRSASGTEVVQTSGPVTTATQAYVGASPPSAPTASVRPRPIVAAKVVPDLTGYQATQARALLVSLGLRVGTVLHRTSSVQPAGAVIATTPSAGASLRGGGVVDLVISSGSSSTGPTTSVTVPDVVGLTLTQAEDRLAAAGIPRAAVAIARSAGSLDLVNKQTPGGGNRIDPAVDKVVLQVGDGS